MKHQPSTLIHTSTPKTAIMFKATLLLLLATQGLCNPIGAYRHPRMGGRDSAPIIANFSWQEFAANTGVDPKAYITNPGKGIEENFTCTKVWPHNSSHCWSVIDTFSSKSGRTESTVLVLFLPGQSRRKTVT